MDYKDHYDALPIYKDWAPTGLAPDLHNLRVLLYQDRDSDALIRSNFEVALTWLGGESEHVKVARFEHWACGWFEIILVDDTVAEKAGEITCSLADFPVLNDDHLAEIEHEDALHFWQTSFTEAERLAYIRDNASQFAFNNFTDVRACVKGETFCGYACDLLA